MVVLKRLSLRDKVHNEKIFFWIIFSFLFLLFISVTLPYLGFARDDWNHYASIRNLYQTLGDVEALRQIITNQWFGAHELRIFFLSFFTHFFVSKADNAEPIIYLIQLSMHGAAAGLLGSVVLTKSKSLKLSLTIVAALLFAPAVSQNTFWINNLFFVQPWFFYSLVVWLAFVPKVAHQIRLALVTLAALICAFSGESTIPLLILTLIGLTHFWFKKESHIRNKARSAIPLGIVSSSLLAYVLFVMMKPPSSGLHFENILQFPKYMAQFTFQALEISRFDSEYFGYAQMVPSIVAVACTLTVAAVLGFTYVSRVDTNGTGNGLSQARMFVIFTLALMASLIPQLIGVITGSRPGPELRYLYVPVQVALIGLALFIWLFVTKSNQTVQRLIAASTTVVLAYFAGLSSYNSTVIWNEQRQIDDKIWAELESQLVLQKWAIVTYHPLHPYLMAPYRSNAVSDFQADWGVAGRLQWLHPERPRMQVFRDAELNKSGRLVLRNYYDDNQNCSLESLANADKQVLFMIFDYGNTFKDLRNSPLLVTSDYAQFEERRDEINKKYLTTGFLSKDVDAEFCSS